MKFDVKKAEDLLYDSKFHIQDHDNKFQFYGIFKSVNPDELTFYITDRAYGSISRGIYTFPSGSNFTMHKLRLDADKKEWIYAATGHIINWKDITETDESKKEGEDMEPNFWKDCVIKNTEWIVNNQIKNGDTVYRIKTDTIDIIGNMIIQNTAYGMMHVEFDNDCECIGNFNIEITPNVRVFKTDSKDDPRILVQHQKCEFNPELRVGRFYRVVNSNLFLQYVMYVRSINVDSIDVNIINMITDLDNKCTITVTDKMLDITELFEYKFDEIDIFKNCKIPFDVEKWFNGSSRT